MRRGEIRRVRSWNYVGHEATGDRPCLIISPDWFNSTGNAIIAPLTTPGPNHETLVGDPHQVHRLHLPGARYQDGATDGPRPLGAGQCHAVRTSRT